MLLTTLEWLPPILDLKREGLVFLYSVDSCSRSSRFRCKIDYSLYVTWYLTLSQNAFSLIVSKHHFLSLNGGLNGTLQLGVVCSFLPRDNTTRVADDRVEIGFCS